MNPEVLHPSSILSVPEEVGRRHTRTQVSWIAAEINFLVQVLLCGWLTTKQRTYDFVEFLISSTNFVCIALRGCFVLEVNEMKKMSFFV